MAVGDDNVMDVTPKYAPGGILGAKFDCYIPYNLVAHPGLMRYSVLDDH